MKRILVTLALVLTGMVLFAQAPHWEEYDYPEVLEEQPLIRALMDKVSSDSLTHTIEHLTAYHTRRWDSRMVYQVQDWLFAQYRDLGYDTVFLHDFPVWYHDSLCETSDNVIAIKRGVVHPDEFVVCGAHYDSYNNAPGHPDSLRAPGADDNASGVAGILETARILSRCTFDRSLMFCNFAAEEIGLIGSAAFAKDCADRGMRIVGYFNLDMIGYLEAGSDIHVNLLYTGQDAPLAQYVTTMSHTYYPDMRIWQDWLPGGSDSDYSSFNRNGYAAIHLFEDTHHSSPYIHTPDDVLGLSVNNLDQAKRFTELHLGLVATLGGLRSNDVGETLVDVLTVYPNPASETLTIRGLAMDRISVFNLLGQRVFTQPCAGASTIDLTVGSWAPGLYVLQVVDADGQVHSAKFLRR